MDIKKYSKSVKCKFCSTHLIKGGIIMAVLAKPIDSLFVVKSEKAEEFLNLKRDSAKMNAILEKANRFNSMRQVK